MDFQGKNNNWIKSFRMRVFASLRTGRMNNPDGGYSMHRYLRFSSRIIILVTLMLSISHYFEKKAFSQTEKDGSKWRGKMQDLYKILAEITTDASSDRRFNSPQNKARIEKNAKLLSDRAHDITKTGLSPDADPTVKIIASQFRDETKRAYMAVKSGNRSYARSILNRASSYCIACHTRTDSGKSFPSLPLEPTSKDLTSIEKGRFYAATRQYDRALSLFQQVLADPSGPTQNLFEWEHAVRYSLAIAVRVKKDPHLAQDLVERVLASKKAPYFMIQDAVKWKESIQKWKEEIPKRATSEEGLRAESIELISKAREQQKYPMDHSADVIYLRASAVLHELLQKYPEGHYTQEALLMLGMCYDVLRNYSVEDLHEVYYEACIHKTPHTSTSEMCFRRYQQSIFDGYTGSSGTYLPPDVIQKLEELESLARPLAIPQS